MDVAMQRSDVKAVTVLVSLQEMHSVEHFSAVCGAVAGVRGQRCAGKPRRRLVCGRGASQLRDVQVETLCDFVRCCCSEQQW